MKREAKLDRNVKKLLLVLLVASTFVTAELVAAAFVASASTLRAQTVPLSSSDKSPAASSTAPGKPTVATKSAGVVWVNRESGVYHKPGMR
jgi:hypothetical protein